jgi:glucose/arabinose dehydrogenase/PKD repeat protein
MSCGFSRWAVPALLACTLLSHSVFASIPAGFENTLVASVANPTALAFTADGRLLITSQTGKLWVRQRTLLLPTPALDLTSVICADSERGLLGVAVDPTFSTTHFIYLYYTFKKAGACERNTTSSPVNRVSRFTLGDANTVSRASELILIDNIPSPNGNHNGGDVHVGRDGFLYISVGDGGCDYRGDSGCAAANDASRDQHVLLGKILRITRTGGIPSSNPFTGSGSVRCNLTGRAQPGQKCQETFALGLRNPFRIAFDPNASGTRFFINDVGQNTWEEIDVGRAGADYGWNVREGHCATGSTTNCGAPAAGMTNPIFDYAHTNGCASITGGAFVPSGVWPLAYEGSYLFADYVCGSIFRLTPTSDGAYTRSTFATGLGSSSVITMIFGPFGGAQALYYASGSGQIRRIAAVVNRSPTAKAIATPSFGTLPLMVRLDASGSTDPDGHALTYEWDFDDGSPHATSATVSHTYSQAGRYRASVTVRDGHGGTDTASAMIDAGNTPPVPAIISPSSSYLFAVGQTITLKGAASDAEDGTLPGSRLTWTVLLHHNTHTHPYLPPTRGNTVAFEAPPPEDLAATTTSYLEIQLRATDFQGATAAVRRNLQPKRVTVTLDSRPRALKLVVNAASVTTPKMLTSWQNYRLSVRAPTQADSVSQMWLPSAWSDGGAASHTIVTPASAATYTATFVPGTVIPTATDAHVRGGTYASTNFGTMPTLNVKYSTGAEYHRQVFLRFSIPTEPIGRAVLRLRGALGAAEADVVIAAYPVANSSWSESTVTWNTKPTVGTSVLASTVVRGTSAAWYEWDLTAYMRAAQTAGRRSVTFALDGKVSTKAVAIFASRQATSYRPQLLVADLTGVTDSSVLLAPTAPLDPGLWQFLMR